MGGTLSATNSVRCVSMPKLIQNKQLRGSHLLYFSGLDKNAFASLYKLFQNKAFEKFVEEGEITKEMISQCENSTVEMIKDIIDNLVYQTASAYCTKCFIDITGAECCCYDWDYTPENECYDKYYANTIFDINDEMKNFIKNGATNIFKKNKKASFWDFHEILNDDEFEEISLKIAENIYKEIKNNNKEIYAMSFGDNHGTCKGEMGGLVEGYYLGDKQINGFLKSDFNIYCLSCH